MSELITLRDIELARGKYFAAKRELLDIQYRFAVQQCPHKVGDKVRVKDSSVPFRGKTVLLERIMPPAFGTNEDNQYEVEGRIVLKNGGLSGRTARIPGRDIEGLAEEVRISERDIEGLAPVDQGASWS